MNANSYLETDLEAVADNVKEIRKEIGTSVKLIPVLKGNAYGLGAVGLAGALTERCGIDLLSVSHPAEGVELRDAGLSCDIMLMSLPLDSQVEEAAAHRLILPLGSFRQFEVLEAAARKLRRKIDVQIKLDTGLHRIGFTSGETAELCRMLIEHREHLSIRGTFSHFSDDCPEHMERQAELFRAGIAQLRGAGIDPGLCHISSSSSIETSDRYFFDAVRIGRRLYMDHPDRPTGKIREAVSFRAWVTDIRTRRAGDTLGYDGAHVLERDTVVGVLSIGYGDGLSPSLAKVHAPVLVNGQQARLLAMCMDQSFLDLTGIPCRPGDEVTLFGHDGHGKLLPSQYIASLAGACEGCGLTTALTSRVERRFV